VKGDRLVFEIIEEVAITPAQNREIKALLFEAFPDGRTAFAETRHWHGSAPQYSVIARRGGRVVGNAGIIVRDIRSGGTAVRVAGIQNLAVHPQERGKNLGGKLLSKGMAEARRRGIDFGLLFCVPELRHYYHSNGWKKIDAAFTMLYQGRTCPIPGKNIAMIRELTDRRFPGGAVDLAGADW
jgi:predicted N-acetyltransferase YhbS